MYITQAHPVVLERYHSMTGIGYLHQYGGYWRWSITKSSDLKTLLTDLLPFLVLKKSQAIVAIELSDGAAISNARRFEIHQQLKDLKKFRQESNY